MAFSCGNDGWAEVLAAGWATVAMYGPRRTYERHGRHRRLVVRHGEDGMHKLNVRVLSQCLLVERLGFLRARITL
jgi:hypothetical protein